MILYPPRVFNFNEWFELIVSLALAFGLWRLRNRFTMTARIAIWLLNVFLVMLADFTAAVKPYDLYDFNDWPQFEYFDLLLYLLIYPASAYLILVVWDLWKPHGWRLAGFIAAAALLTTGLEAVAAYGFEVFTYKGWRLPWSFPVYVAVYAINIRMVLFARKEGF